MTRATLLTPEIRAWIGRTYPPVVTEVTPRDIAKYCAASGEEDPRALAPEVAPPLFYMALTPAVSPFPRLREDGLCVENLLPPLPLKRLMAGGVDVELRAPIRAGDTLTAVTRLSDIREHSGQSGPFILSVLETTVTNQRDEVVVIERQTILAR
jgi:3-methylfumaryl-CoA hydratase